MRLDDGRVVPNFLQQSLCGEPLTIYGDGLQTRSFCYVDDLIDGIVKLLYSNEHMPVNIGNPVETTILEFAEIINHVVGNNAGVKFMPSERLDSDPQRRQPDISRAKKTLEWEPVISLEEGINRTIPYFRQKLGK
jgi:dTDP-glucose 4,6-dehydratase